jgi:hypothetical protein
VSSGREVVAPVGVGHDVSRAPPPLAWRSLSSGQAASRRGWRWQPPRRGVSGIAIERGSIVSVASRLGLVVALPQMTDSTTAAAGLLRFY